MKKYFCLFLCIALLLGTLTGCGAASAANGGTSEPAQKLSVVATIFPEYDWVRQILGDKANGVELTLLLDNGADLHSYQPTADDMVKISSCDLFIYVGGESDEWVEDALANAVNKNMLAINLLDVLGDAVKEEELVEGMQGEEEEESEEGEEEVEYDEHVWLSLKNAAVLCGAIADALSKLDAANADAYAANATAYIEKLNALDARYAAAVNAASTKTLLFGDRFPFRYLADDYGLDYYAAFVGCSAETEASFETIVFLAGKVDELGLNTVLTIESGDGKIARTIIENTAEKSAQALKMDSMQSTTARNIADGATYLGAMEENLAVLRQALQ
jgi:zinc transport system substrate-binding protein